MSGSEDDLSPFIRAGLQAEELKARATAPPDVVIRTAQYEQQCPACPVKVMPGDEIASALGAWAHLACSMCLDCGGWLTRHGSGRVCPACGIRPGA